MHMDDEKSSSSDGEGWLQRFDADDAESDARAIVADVRDSIRLPGVLVNESFPFERHNWRNLLDSRLMEAHSS